MIDNLRKEIDAVDADLVKLLAKRLDLVRQVGEEKKKEGVEVHQKTREIEVLDKVKLLGDTLGLEDEFIADLYSVIFAESRKAQD